MNYLTKGLQKIDASKKYYLVVLESERVRDDEIRDLLKSSDIKIIDCLSFGMKDVKDFLEKLIDTQVQ